MKTFLAIFSAFLLTACATQTREVQVKVEVPIPVPCIIAHIDKPIFILQEAKPEEAFGVKLKKALSEIETRKAYEIKLEAAIRSCQ